MNSTFWQSFNKRLAACAAAILAWGAVPGTAWAVAPRLDVLEAIHRVENPHNSQNPGKHGELGAYQFRQQTWRMHTNLPFEFATDPDVAETVAVKHYEWLKRELERNDLPPTAYNIALAWNGGLRAAVRGRSSPAARDYAERVNNIVQEMRATRLASVH